MAREWNDGALRTRLAKLIEQVCSTETRKVTCKVGDIRGSVGGRRNLFDASYVWTARVSVEGEHSRELGCYQTMKQCVRMGFVLSICETYGDWEALAFGEVDGRWGSKMTADKKRELNVVVPKGVRL
jgi:hypothetical protein